MRDAQRDYPKELIVAVSADGASSVDRQLLAGRSLDSLSAALT